MPKLKPGTLIPSDYEDQLINAAIASDPDTYELTDAQFIKLQMQSSRIPVTLPFDIVEQFQRTGAGWQSRIDAALKQWLLDHPTARLD